MRKHQCKRTFVDPIPLPQLPGTCPLLQHAALPCRGPLLQICLLWPSRNWIRLPAKSCGCRMAAECMVHPLHLLQIGTWPTSGCWSLVISYKMDTSKLLKSMQQQATQLVTPTFQRLSSDQDDFIMMRKQEKTLYLFYG